jgi:plasmid stabilization system protein ParE
MIVYLPGAMADLRGIAQWYAARRPEGQARFFERLRLTIGRVERQPTSFPIVLEDAGVRKARILRTAYWIAFVMKDEQVRVIAVVHGARRPDFWVRRVRP